MFVVFIVAFSSGGFRGGVHVLWGFPPYTRFQCLLSFLSGSCIRSALHSTTHVSLRSFTYQWNSVLLFLLIVEDAHRSQSDCGCCDLENNNFT